MNILVAGEGQTTKLSALLKKLIRGMEKPKWFFAILRGITHGAKAKKLYQNVPEDYSPDAIQKWSRQIAKLDIPIRRGTSGTTFPTR